MKRWWKRSILLRAGLAVSVITLLALASALSGVLFAWASAGDAAAINTAGSLRMATYRLTWRLDSQLAQAERQALREDFERRLEGSGLRAVLDGRTGAPLDHAYAGLVQRWHRQMAPALAGNDARTFQDNADDFVAQLDDFVLQLQRRSERQRHWQQVVQGSALLSTIVVLLLGLHQLQAGVLTPLRELLRVTRLFRDGDHQARIRYTSNDELGQVAQSFNAMAEAIETSHRTLAQRIAEETEHLARANAALQLLYQSGRAIATEPTSAEALQALLDDFRRNLPGLDLSLRLRGNRGDDGDAPIVIEGRAQTARSAEQAHAGQAATGAPMQLVYGVSSQKREIGELVARFGDGQPPQRWERDLIQALANLIGTALSLERRRLQEHQLILFEERAIIARELHDSLAQSLSYMKLQVGRLQTMIRRGESAPTLEAVSEEIRDGLNDAYRQLRELLVTFRLKIHEGGLGQALAEAVDEFGRRGRFDVISRIRPLPFSLAGAEEIHLLQIFREALSNCAAHSDAHTVWVSFAQEGAEVVLMVEDDGRGLSEDFDQRHHHGLSIMRERAANLGGRLLIEPRRPAGTRVRLAFSPRFLRTA